MIFDDPKSQNEEEVDSDDEDNGKAGFLNPNKGVTDKKEETAETAEKEPKKDLATLFADVREKQPIEACKLQALLAGEKNANRRLSDDARKVRSCRLCTG